MGLAQARPDYPSCSIQSIASLLSYSIIINLMTLNYTLYYIHMERRHNLIFGYHECKQTLADSRWTIISLL